MSFDGRSYQERFDRLEAEGMDVHGEARFVMSYSPGSVLDAGCGTGRVAIELARLGVDVVGVDVDPSMISEARRRAPGLQWVLADLAELCLARSFDVVVLAGNVPLFCSEVSRPALVSSCAAHVGGTGGLVAGFELGRGYTVAEMDRDCAAAGLALSGRWSSWDRELFVEESPYAVSVWSRA